MDQPPPQAQAAARTVLRVPEPKPYIIDSNMEIWIDIVERFFNSYDEADDATRFSWAAANLRGPAQELTLGMEPSWDGLKALLVQRFTHNRKSVCQRNELLEINQGSSPLEDYLKKFHALQLRAKSVEDLEAAWFFTRGLHKELSARVTQAAPETLAGAIEQAQTDDPLIPRPSATRAMSRRSAWPPAHASSSPSFSSPPFSSPPSVLLLLSRPSPAIIVRGWGISKANAPS